MRLIKKSLSNRETTVKNYADFFFYLRRQDFFFNSREKFSAKIDEIISTDEK